MKGLKRSLKRLLLSMSDRTSHLKVGTQCADKKWVGSDYGGFYVCPKGLKKGSIVYSFGIGEDISFDLQMINQYGSQVFGFDPTPRSKSFVSGQKDLGGSSFYEFGLASSSGPMDFFMPANPEHVSGSVLSHKNVATENKLTVEMKSFDDLTDELGHNHVDIVKMDIEGSEYDVIESILKSEVSVHQLLIEFHDRFFTEGSSKSKEAVALLRASNYEIFAISSSFEEVSFIKLD